MWPAQLSFFPQTLPHPPQLLSSELRSTQAPPHSANPAGQTQRPATQLVPPVQATPQLPQLAESLVRLTQLLPHGKKGGVQVPTQLPAWQNGVAAAQTWPQLPQFCGSLSSGRQEPPQAAVPTGQLQTPALQLSPALQALVQPPQ
jgi:hypothetical protein